MKGVMSVVPQHILDERRRTGADQWDEMWEGVLHMTPAPNKRHSRLGVQIRNWLDDYWAQPGGNDVDLQLNVASVGGWPHDYRIPDNGGNLRLGGATSRAVHDRRFRVVRLVCPECERDELVYFDVTAAFH